jgi:hypothetical protein
MRMLKASKAAAWLITWLAVQSLLAAEPSNEKVPIAPDAFVDVQGKSWTPLMAGDRSGIVLVFVSPYCPTSNAFTPELARIVTEYSERFAFYIVEADREISSADAKKHAESLAVKAPILLDPTQRLALLTKAKFTPEAVVLAKDGEVLYRGRINDLYLSPTKKQKEPMTHDLRNALEAIKGGKAAPVSRTKAVGCSISGV